MQTIIWVMCNLARLWQGTSGPWKVTGRWPRKQPRLEIASVVAVVIKGEWTSVATVPALTWLPLHNKHAILPLLTNNKSDLSSGALLEGSLTSASLPLLHLCYTANLRGWICPHLYSTFRRLTEQGYFRTCFGYEGGTGEGLNWLLLKINLSTTISMK